VLCVVTWFFYSQIKRHREDADHLFHALSLAMASALLVIQNQGFMRIQQYFSVFIMLTVPELINVIKREYRILGYLAFGAVMIFYLIQNDPAYRFFFM
jgi:transmembrane protein EpsG